MPQAKPERRIGPPPVSEAADAGLLARITARLADGGDLGTLLQHFLEPVVALAGASAGAVRVLTPAGDELSLVSSLGLPQGLCLSEQAVDRHCGACGEAASGKALAWASDLGECGARSGAEYFGGHCRRMLAVPLQHRGQVLGVYNLFFGDTDAPRPEVLAMLRSIGELLGLALNNARLEQEHLRASLLLERQAMAAEVHDSLAQGIAFLKMRMPLLEDALKAGDQTRALRYCDDVRGAASQAHASLRGLITHLRVPMDPLGLAHALDDCARRFSSQGGPALEFVNEVPNLSLPAEHEAQVFHIVQEALANVLRHAAAERARLRIALATPHELEVAVEDDGAGLPVAAASSGGTHYGLEIMGERARRLGGTLEVGPRPGGGTCVRLRFPIGNVLRACAGTEAA
jgi:two-component system, NarL family, nitrate/nitrite sensor histidine kinase NarX